MADDANTPTQHDWFPSGSYGYWIDVSTDAATNPKPSRPLTEAEWRELLERPSDS